ncbi:MAG: sigma-54-dependent Fis family transcriptional regulator [bacterium]|nr:sigma-54-dependent Fis family transcriptional regulator [bacterium]
MRILLVEDERMTRVALAGTLTREGHEVVACADGTAGLGALGTGEFEAVLTDLRLPGASGLDLLREAQRRGGRAKVVIMTAFASTDSAIEALRLGAYDYVSKPFRPEEILTILGHIEQLHSVQRENRELKRRIRGLGDAGIVGSSPVMRALRETIRAVAPGGHTVLITGPSGTGKEVAARALHELSTRASGPFVAINCAALPETLLESELFGYRKGAFTGADRDHQGYFESARGGTLFLDDIDDVPVSMQVKLLRVIQEREVHPVGSRRPVPIDIRLVAAAKTDLKGLVAGGTFRADLYYRLNVIPLRMPLLRERREDIPELVRHFVTRHGGDVQRCHLDPHQSRLLAAHDWPGNVRELENLVERWLALPDHDLRELLGESPPRPRAVPASPPELPHVDGEAVDYREYMDRCERRLLDWALARSGGNVTTAARLLQLPRSTLRSRLEN